MIAHGGIKQPNIVATKIVFDGHIAAGYGIRNKMSDLIKWNIIHTKPPDKILNIVNVLLVGFWGKECLEQPLAVVNLTNLTNLLEGGNTLTHDRNFPWAVKNFLDGNWGGVANVDDALVIMNGCEDTRFIKHTPIFLDEIKRADAFLGDEWETSSSDRSFSP